MKLAQRMSRLGTETAFEVLAKAKALEAQGREIIHLEIGEPDFNTPANVVEAGIAGLRNGQTHYTPAAGVLPLRQTIADEVAKTRGIPVHPDQVVVVPGGKPIMFYAMLALCEAGDEVIYPNPGFPIYELMIQILRCNRGAHSAAHGERLRAGCRRAAEPDHRPHALDHPQLSGQSHRWRVVKR